MFVEKQQGRPKTEIDKQGIIRSGTKRSNMRLFLFLGRHECSDDS